MINTDSSHYETFKESEEKSGLLQNETGISSQEPERSAFNMFVWGRCYLGMPLALSMSHCGK